MSWLDNLISFISPEWGAKREAWRQNLEEMRSYDAGDYSRGNANWRVINQSAEYTDKYSKGLGEKFRYDEFRYRCL